MKTDETLNQSRDSLSDWRFAGSMYWLPALALIASGFLSVDQVWRTAIWTVALTTMGVGCVANALRCGRVHCYLTGPFFLIMALSTNIEPTFVTRASSLAYKSSLVYIAGTLTKTVSAVPVPASVIKPVMIGVGNNPVRIVANPAQHFVYVANVADDTVSIINTAMNKNVQTLAVGAEPEGLAVSPDGNTLVVANEGDGTATIVNVGTSPAQILSTVFVGGEPTSVTINTDGSRAYLANLFCPGNGSNCDPDGHSPNGVVEAILLNSMPPTTQCCVVVGEAPTDIEFDPTGRYLWVVNSRSETVTIVDSHTNTVVSSTNMSALSLQAGSRFISAIP